MNQRILICSLIAHCLIGTVSSQAQEKSVRPGINDPFLEPDIPGFVERFETESREVYVKREKIIKACQIKPGDAIADVGAGTGLFSLLLSGATGNDGNVVAVDISQMFLDHILKKAEAVGKKNITTRLCNQESIDLPVNSFDVVFVCDTYHHFEFPAKSLESISKALKPDGRLIVIDFRKEEGKSTAWVMSHVRATQEVVEKEITDAGFKKKREEKDLLSENFFIEMVKNAK